ncbi:MAG: RNA methyltransferase [Kiritimatiellaeota bacterium]|nr:RNA methyltransferase [Kiritimatiellota bacterium]
MGKFYSMKTITSSKNPGVKLAKSLRSRNKREKSGLTLLEGYRAVSRALECGMELDTCYYCPALFLGENEIPLINKIARSGAEIAEVEDHILRAATYRDRPEGILVVAKTRSHPLSDLPIVENGLYVVAESIEKPGNLGSILRSADAADVDGMILCDKKTDLYNPNTITASTGALFSVKIADCSSEKASEWLKKNKIATIAATPEAEKVYYDTDLTGGVAFVVGAEQYGLSDFWKERADINVKIPMLGYIDSLNVATAATVALFEAARQRATRQDKAEW